MLKLLISLWVITNRLETSRSQCLCAHSGSSLSFICFLIIIWSRGMGGGGGRGVRDSHDEMGIVNDFWTAGHMITSWVSRGFYCRSSASIECNTLNTPRNCIMPYGGPESDVCYPHPNMNPQPAQVRIRKEKRNSNYNLLYENQFLKNIFKFLNLLKKGQQLIVRMCSHFYWKQ